MGDSSRIGEIDVVPEPSRNLIVDSHELRVASSQLVALASKFDELLRRLTNIEHHLLGAGAVPGGAMSAAPGRAALSLGVLQLRGVRSRVDDLGVSVGVAAEQYEEKESLARRLFLIGQSASAAWVDFYGSWFVTPVQLLSVPLSRFYLASVRQRRSQLAPNQRWALGGPALWGIGSAGLVYYHQIASLSPIELPAFARHVVTTGRLLPQALQPVVDPTAAGIDRAEAGELAQSLSGLVAPGGDVGDGAALLAGGVSDLHSLLGHQRIRLEPLAPREQDLDRYRSPVRSFADSLAVMEELDPGNGANHGELRIDRVTAPGGERSWQVFIPGGQGFNPTSVHSLLHAASAVDAQITPSAVMVAQALREVGAVKGEPIVITGHSHGGITGSLIANDSRLRAEFDVPLVIAAGSPIDRHEIRPDTHIISFEHIEDPIPGADGITRQLKPGLTRVERTLAESADPRLRNGQGIFHSHDYPNYVNTAQIADAHPELAHMQGLLEGIIPDGEVQTYRFRAEIG